MLKERNRYCALQWKEELEDFKREVQDEVDAMYKEALDAYNRRGIVDAIGKLFGAAVTIFITGPRSSDGKVTVRSAAGKVKGTSCHQDWEEFDPETFVSFVNLCACFRAALFSSEYCKSQVVTKEELEADADEPVEDNNKEGEGDAGAAAKVYTFTTGDTGPVVLGPVANEGNDSGTAMSRPTTTTSQLEPSELLPSTSTPSPTSPSNVSSESPGSGPVVSGLADSQTETHSPPKNPPLTSTTVVLSADTHPQSLPPQVSAAAANTSSTVASKENPTEDSSLLPAADTTALPQVELPSVSPSPVGASTDSWNSNNSTLLAPFNVFHTQNQSPFTSHLDLFRTHKISMPAVYRQGQSWGGLSMEDLGLGGSPGPAPAVGHQKHSEDSGLQAVVEWALEEVCLTGGNLSNPRGTQQAQQQPVIQLQASFIACMNIMGPVQLNDLHGEQLFISMPFDPSTTTPLLSTPMTPSDSSLRPSPMPLQTVTDTPATTPLPTLLSTTQLLQPQNMALDPTAPSVLSQVVTGTVVNQSPMIPSGPIPPPQPPITVSDSVPPLQSWPVLRSLPDQADQVIEKLVADGKENTATKKHQTPPTVENQSGQPAQKHWRPAPPIDPADVIAVQKPGCTIIKPIRFGEEADPKPVSKPKVKRGKGKKGINEGVVDESQKKQGSKPV
ncbi:hypothetical protein AAF712_015851 [Marasmius tenuissimus]|uniref:Uncharacterized protein n=1 Tax=Marasmius tenuissimus TaxID=585030 RepID=A0ABR2Z7E3_9AGAR